jgi:hypothetical protein
MMKDDRSISASALKAQLDEFSDRVQVNGSSYSGPPILLQWGSLESIMRPLVSANSSYYLGVKAYMGWDGSDLRIAIAPIFLIPATGNEYRVHELQPNEVVRSGTKWVLDPILDWNTRWVGNSNALIDAYYSKTTIDRSGTGQVGLSPTKDPCATLISYDGALLPMFQQNSENGDDPDLVQLKISPAAKEFTDNDGGPQGFRPILCFNIAYNGQDRLDEKNEDPTRPYRSRGADFAVPCPTTCFAYTAK